MRHCFFNFFNAGAQQNTNFKLLDWRPRSELVVPQTDIIKPKFPVIDIHNHLGKLEQIEEFLKEMDKAGVTAAVSLDGHQYSVAISEESR
ncbi:MAG: hypothetical protein M3142_10360 [Bacteroidota bacterium]|nr:hypothetical protein [Bacteroidota bacterium]